MARDMFTNNAIDTILAKIKSTNVTEDTQVEAGNICDLLLMCDTRQYNIFSRDELDVFLNFICTD